MTLANRRKFAQIALTAFYIGLIGTVLAMTL